MPMELSRLTQPAQAGWALRSRVATALAVERISGPFRGKFFVAAYTVESAEGYYGYAKVCEGRPPDVWSAVGINKVGTDIDYAHAGDALDAAERMAAIAIARGGWPLRVG